MKRIFKQLFFSVLCVLAFATVSSCDKVTASANMQKVAGAAPAGYVDLGLPSGTMWKAKNEKGYFTYTEAVEKFSGSLPSEEQIKELLDNCKKDWTKNGLKLTGPNGKSIVLPASGYRYCSSTSEALDKVGSIGYYWTSKSIGSEFAIRLEVSRSYFEIRSGVQCLRLPVRLVKAQ